MAIRLIVVLALSSAAAGVRDEHRVNQDQDIDASLMQMIQSAAATAAELHRSASQSQESPFNDTQSSRPEVEYDEAWFDRQCNLGADPTASAAYYKENPWQDGKKCEFSPGGDLQEFNSAEVADQEACERRCNEVSATSPGDTYCCEWDPNVPLCTVSKSFLSLAASSKGNRLIDFRKRKSAKFVRSDRVKSDKSSGEEYDELQDVQENQAYMRKLTEQVNHMSIEGILKHLLSFYVCMRWVPDDQFVRLAKDEMEHVDVDSKTMRVEGEFSKEDAINAYINFDAVPLKCSSGIDVQNSRAMKVMLQELSDEHSDIVEAYHFSMAVADQTFNGLGGQKWWGKTESTEKRMGNAMEVDEMARKARSLLPWDGFIRPSQRYTWLMSSKWQTHISKPKNLFVVCFGPRVSSFPQKREHGTHFLADMNMAGCNGLWDIAAVTRHVLRIQQLFAPETCLTDDLKRKLKTTFLETFVEMNQGFENKLTGNIFSQKALGTIPDELKEKSVVPLEEEMDFVSEGKAHKKFQNLGRLVSGAHTKWVVCDAKSPESGAHGHSETFFNSPQAYKKWFAGADLSDNTKPECKTYDPRTGCVKCVVAVRSHPWRCLQRLGLNFEEILAAVDKQMYPMSSRYTSVRTETDERGQEKQFLEKKDGVCLVMKDIVDDSRLTNKDDFRVIGENDRVMQVQRSKVGDMGFVSRARYSVEARRKALAEYILNGEAAPEQLTPEQELQKAVRKRMFEGSETHLPADRFGPLMTFSEVVDEVNNIPAHEVDYFYSCPCEPTDFSALSSHKRDANLELSDYRTLG